MGTATKSARETVISGRMTPEVSPMLSQLTIFPTFGDPRLPPRFWAKVYVLDNGCWEWTAGRNWVGYAKFDANGRTEAAHRWAYRQLIGPIPEGLTLDHLCKNRACVFPDHMEPVTMRENVLRGNGLSAIAARQTHCTHGHPFDEANTRREPDGHRSCRACGRIRQQRYRDAQVIEALVGKVYGEAPGMRCEIRWAQ